MRSATITSHPLWSGGQHKAEYRTTAGIGFTFQPTAMRLDDRAANRLRLTPADEGSQAPDNTSGAQYFRCRLVHDLRDRFDLVTVSTREQAARRVDEIGGGDHDLVQLMCQSGSHLTHSTEACGVEDFRLQFSQP